MPQQTLQVHDDDSIVAFEEGFTLKTILFYRNLVHRFRQGSRESIFQVPT